MTQKAVAYETRADKIVKQDKNLRELYGLHRQRVTIKQVNISPGGATPSSAGSSGGTGNFLETKGDTMMGPIAFNPAVVNITSDGHIQIGENDRTTPNGIIDFSSYVLMVGLGSPDDLYFIDGAAYSGQLLYLQGTASQIINVHRATLPSISSISGTGTVSVTTGVDHNLTTGDKVNIVGTTNFDVQNVSVTVTGVTTFTYSDAGSGSPESSGLVQDGNIVTDNGEDVEMDGTIALNGVPVLTLIFDVLIAGFGGWRVIANSAGGAGGSNVPDGTTENDHLQWDSGAWVARQTFEFGATDTFMADSGFLRFINDDIMISARNAAATGNIEVKVDAGDFLDITESNNGIAKLKIRAQHAIDPDNDFFISQFSGTGAPVSISTNAQFNFDIVATPVFGINVTEADFLVDVDINNNDLIFGGGNKHQIIGDATNIIRAGLGSTQVVRYSDTVYNFTNVEIEHEDTNAPPIHNYFRDGTTLDDDSIGIINFKADNSVSTKTLFASMFVTADDVTNASEDSSIWFSTLTNGFINTKFRIDGTGLSLFNNLGGAGTNINGVEEIFFNFTNGSPDFASLGATSSSELRLDMLDDSDRFIIRHDGDTSVRFLDFQTQFYSFDHDNEPASIEYWRDDDAIGVGDVIGELVYDSLNDDEDEITYARFLGSVGDPTEDEEAGRFTFQLASPQNFGFLLNRMRISADNLYNYDNPIKFDSRLTPDLDLISATQGMLYAKDLGAGTTAPFWLDDNGVESNLITGGGGGGGSATAGLSVVKEADQSKSSDTTLDIDDELFFTPQADTIYLLEFDLRYSTGFTDLDVAIQGGADMTYFIVETNIDATAQLWSSTSSSNVEKLTFNLNALNAPSLATGYAIVQVNTDVDPVGVSWAQNSSNASATFMLKGSGLKIYPGGSAGGGTQGEVVDVKISNAASNIFPADGHEDVNGDYFGQGNGAESAGIALGSVNPGVPTVTHTLIASDMPKGIPGFNMTEFTWMVAINVRNGGAGPGVRFVYQPYLNGVPIDSPITSIGLVINPGTDGQGERYILQDSLTVSVGDTLGVAVWEQSASTLTLEHYVFYTLPGKMEIDNNLLHHLIVTNLGGDNDARALSGPDPIGFVGTAQLRKGSANSFEVNGSGPNFPFTAWDAPMFQGALLDATDNNFGTGSGSFSIGNRLDIPYQGSINEYQYLTALT